MHSDPTVHPLIDESLEQLLKLPTVANQPSTTPSFEFLSHNNQTPTFSRGTKQPARLLTSEPPSATNELHRDTVIERSTTTASPSGSITTSLSNTATGSLNSSPPHSHITVPSYSTFNTESTTDVGSYLEISRQSFGLQGDRFEPDLQSLSQSTTSLPTDYLPRSSVDAQLAHSPSSGTRSTQLSLENSWSPYAPVSGCGLSFPYSASRVIPDGEDIEVPVGGGASSSSFEGEIFPWLRLTINDRNILATTQSRVRNSSGDSLLRSCEFLEDVLFQDFPAELFLQRPALIKSLINLLEGHEGSSSELLTILRCLSSYVCHLQQRLSVVMDPSLALTDSMSKPVGKRTVAANGTPHRPFLSSSDQPSPSGSLEEFEELTSDMLVQLQSEQLSIPDFCLSVISTISPLILCFFNKDSFLTHSSLGSPAATNQGSLKLGGSKGFTSSKMDGTSRENFKKGLDHFSGVVSHLVSVCLEILTHSVGVLTVVGSFPYHGQSAVNCEVTVDTICSVLSQCLSKWRRLAMGGIRGEAVPFCPQLQMVCSVTVQLSSCLCQVLNMNKTSAILPLPTVLNGLMMNGVLGQVYPQLQDQLLLLFETVDAPNCRLFLQVRTMATSFKCMKMFLSCHTTVDNLQANEESLTSAVDCAQRGLDGLWFTTNKEFIQKAMELCFSILSEYKAVSTVHSSSKELLLRLLGHGSDLVRELAFRHLKEHSMKCAVDIKETEGGTSIRADHEHMDSDLVREVCCYGVVSRRECIVAASCQVVCTLLSLHTESLWPQVWQNFLQWMPFIEVSLSESEFLYKEFQQLLESRDRVDVVIRLQVFTRLLFTSNTEIRMWSFRNISTLILTVDSESASGWFSFPSQSPVPLHDLFVLSTHTLTGGVLTRQQSSFKHEDIVKLVHILKSPTMDSSLKKSALEQMALILQDQLLHEQVLQDELSDDLLSTILPPNQKQNVTDRTLSPEEREVSLSLIKPCLKCLQLLACSSADLRNKISDNYSILLTIFKAALHFHDDKEFLCCASKLLTLSLFGSFVRVSDDGTVQLPEALVERLKFSFPVESYELERHHLTPSPLDPKLFTSDPLLSMLRLNYYSAMIGSPEQIISAYESHQLPLEDEKLAIPQSDILSMKSLSVMLSLKEYFYKLKLASSHDGVIAILHHIKVVLNNCTLYGELWHFQNLFHDGQIEWKKTIERFLTVRPSTTEDVSLLTSVLGFLHTLVTVKIAIPHRPAINGYLVVGEGLAWLTEITCDCRAMCLQLLQSSLDSAEQSQHSNPHRLLLKALLQFIGTLIWRNYTDNPTAAVTMSSLKVDMLSSLTQSVCQCLDVAGCPDYYDLPLLEKSLDCLLHLSASSNLMVGTPSQLPHKLFVKLMTSLRQVLWSFISGRGFMIASFMGRGVTSRAALSLSHIVQAISSMKQTEGWLSQWLRSSPDIGLSWLHYLLDDRDPRVQYASFSLIASLCCKTELVDVILAAWTDHPFGLWGICLMTALDGSKCSLVKQQALYALVCVSAVCNQQKKWSHYLSYNIDGLSLNGEKALEQLIHTHKLFSTLHSIVQSDCLVQFRKEVTSLLYTLNDLPNRAQTPLLMQASHNEREHTLTEENDNPSESQRKKGCSVDDKDFQLDPNKSPPSLKSDKSKPTDSPSLEGETLEHVSELIQSLVCYCDPLFVSGVCKLLHNLVLAFPEFIASHVHKEGVLGALVRIIDINTLKLFVLAAREGVVRYPLLSMWVKMYYDIVELMKVMLCLQPEVAVPHFQRDELLASLCEAMSIVRNTETCREDKHCLQLCSNVLELLNMTVERSQGSPQRTDAVFVGIQKHWSSFIDLLLYSLEKTDNSPLLCSLRSHTLRTLSRLLVHLSQPSISGRSLERNSSSTLQVGSERSAVLSQLVDSEVNGNQLSTGEERKHCSHGVTLCTSIMKAYDMSMSGSSNRRQLGETLGILLASSTTAKSAALANGLLESAIDQLKALGSKVKGDSVHPASQSNKKKKECPLVSECIAIINLLRNFMYRSVEVKSAAVNTPLISVTHKLWHWCSINRKLMLPTLRMLTVLTSHHPGGQMCIATSTKGTQSLLHSVLKLCSVTLTSHSSSKLSNSDVSLLNGLFILLANCTLSQESRAVIKKVGFLSLFGTLNPKSEKGTSQTGGSNRRSLPARLSSLWVRFLVNLSFSGEGQQMIIKQPGSLDVLADIYWSSSGENQIHTMLALRNLCFYGPSKTLLASNELFLAVVTHSLDSGNKVLITLASSAIWALLHNCAKVKKTLKQSVVIDSLDTVHSNLQLLKLTSKHSCIEESENEPISNCSEDDKYFKVVSKAYTLLR